MISGYTIEHSKSGKLEMCGILRKLPAVLYYRQGKDWVKIEKKAGQMEEDPQCYGIFFSVRTYLSLGAVITFLPVIAFLLEHISLEQIA